MKNSILLIILSLGITIGCQKDNDLANSTFIDPHFESSDPVLVVAMDLSIDIINVAPSGDLSGVTDADNIENALEEAKSTGGMVLLTDGDANTVDHYYTSRNVVVSGFNGTLAGESMNNTIIHAGRKSAEIGFTAAISPYWSTWGYPPFATVLQLDNSTGNVAIKDLAIWVKDDQPTDLQPDDRGILSTYMSTFIEILGGEHNTMIENIRLEGKASGAPGNRGGMNSAWGVHVMLGPPGGPFGKGNLMVKNIEVENISLGAVLFMRFQDGSNISVDALNAKNVGQGVYAGGVFDSFVKITNSNISLHSSGYQGMWLWSMPTGLEIANNTIRGSRFRGLNLDYGINNATVTNNKFADIKERAAIFVRGTGNVIEHNDYIESNLPGWSSTSNGPGAIQLHRYSQDNRIHEMKFPPAVGVSVCQMVLDLTDDPGTFEYDGANIIHNWEPCEHISQNAPDMPGWTNELGVETYQKFPAKFSGLIQNPK